jgi:hypothetical protein
VYRRALIRRPCDPGGNAVSYFDALSMQRNLIRYLPRGWWRD